MTNTKWHTPPQLAQRLRVSCEKITGWIRAGELEGVNLASTGSKRPRFRVSEDALERFLLSRSATVSAPPKRRPRKTARKFY